jgi:hypothetical protein
MMSNIPKIIPDAALGKVDKGQQTHTQPAKEASQDKVTPESEKRDLLQVDQKRQEEVRLTENAKLLLEEFSDVRPDRVREARRRLESGYYDRLEILQRAAEKILDDDTALRPIHLKDLGAINQAADDENRTEHERVQNARRRLLNGYYEQSEILDETARKILKKNP